MSSTLNRIIKRRLQAPQGERFKRVIGYFDSSDDSSCEEIPQKCEIKCHPIKGEKRVKFQHERFHLSWAGAKPNGQVKKCHDEVRFGTTARLTARALRLRLRNQNKASFSDFNDEFGQSISLGEGSAKIQVTGLTSSGCQQKQSLLTSFFQFKNQKFSEDGNSSLETRSHFSTHPSEVAAVNAKRLLRGRNGVDAEREVSMKDLCQDQFMADTESSRKAPKEASAFTTNPRRSQRLELRKARKAPARIVIHKRTGKHKYVHFKSSRRTGARIAFTLLSERDIPFAKAFQTQFKKQEDARHTGADQDCDTDEENLEYGKGELMKSLRQAIDTYQKGGKAYENINNLQPFGQGFPIKRFD